MSSVAGELLEQQSLSVSVVLANYSVILCVVIAPERLCLRSAARIGKTDFGCAQDLCALSC